MFPKVLIAPWLLILWLLAVPSHGQVLLLDPVTQGKPLGEYLEYWVDESGNATIDDAAAESEWRSVLNPVPNYGISTLVYWFKLDVQSASDTDKWLMKVGYGLLDHLDVYILEQDGPVRESYSMGTARPITNRPLVHRLNVFPLPNSNVPNYTVFLRVHSYHSLQLPLTVWLEPEFIVQDEMSNLGLGLLFGCLSVMLLYNFFLYTNLRDPLYLIYVGLVLSLILLQFSIKGLGYRYVWTGFSEWSALSTYFAGYCAAFFGTSFAVQFLALKQRKYPFYGLMSGLRWLCLGCALAIYWIPKDWSLKILAFLVMTIVLLGTLAIAFYYRSNDRSIRIFSMAWVLFLVGALLLIANKLGVMPVNYWTEHTIAVGMVVEMVLFSMALGDRINQEKAETLEAKEAYLTLLKQERKANQVSLENEVMERKAKEMTLKLRRENNQKLEQEVQLQTQELQDATEKLAHLIRIDPLTQVFNRHYFNEQLQKYCGPDRELPGWLCLMMIDIDHFKSVNDTYGHLAGDQCIQWLVKTIGNSVHYDQAQLFRYGGEEFALLIPQLESHSAIKLAQWLCGCIADEETHIENGPSRITVSIGVLCLEVDGYERPENLVQMADKALYEAKYAGRNRVVMADYKVRKHHG